MNMSRHMKVVFTASLLLNIVLVAMAAGTYYRFHHDMPYKEHDISPQAREILSNAFEQGRTEIGPMFNKIKAERNQVEDILTADEFDEQAYDSAVANMLDARESITRKRAEIMGRALAQLPPEDRLNFADKVLDKLEGHRPHKGGAHKRMMRNDRNKQQSEGTVAPR